MDSRTLGLELLTAEQMQTVVGGSDWSIIWDFGEDRGIQPTPPPPSK